MRCKRDLFLFNKDACRGSGNRVFIMCPVYFFHWGIWTFPCFFKIQSECRMRYVVKLYLHARLISQSSQIVLNAIQHIPFCSFVTDSCYFWILFAALVFKSPDRQREVLESKCHYALLKCLTHRYKAPTSKQMTERHHYWVFFKIATSVWKTSLLFPPLIQPLLQRPNSRRWSVLQFWDVVKPLNLPKMSKQIAAEQSEVDIYWISVSRPYFHLYAQNEWACYTRTARNCRLWKIPHLLDVGKPAQYLWKDFDISSHNGQENIYQPVSSPFSERSDIVNNPYTVAQSCIVFGTSWAPSEQDFERFQNLIRLIVIVYWSQILV